MDTALIQATVDEVVASLADPKLAHYRQGLALAKLLPFDVTVQSYLLDESKKIELRQQLLTAVAESGTRFLQSLAALLSDGYPAFPIETVPADVLAAIRTHEADLRAIEDLFQLPTVSATQVISTVGPEIPQA